MVSVQMKTAIIIPTYKRPALMERLLHSLEQAAPPPDTRIYIIENGPQTGIQEICARSGLELHYRHFPIGHKSAALNFAIENSTEDLLVFFDDDVAVSRNIIATYTEAARGYGPGYFFGGPLAADAETVCPADLKPYLPLSALGWAPADHEVVMDKEDFEYFFGANWAVFRSDLQKVGLFSEELGINASPRSPMGEENDIQLRLLQADVKPVYLPDALVLHHVPHECYTMKWVSRRRFRLGVTDWKRKEKTEQAHCRKLLGVPAWLVRAVMQHMVKALASRILGWTRKTEIRMQQAYLQGLLYGAWITRNMNDHPM